MRDTMRIKPYKIPFWRRKYSYYRYFLLVCIIVIAIIVVSAYDTKDIKTKIKDSIKDIEFSKSSSAVKISSNYCEENIVPDNFTMYTNPKPMTMGDNKPQIISDIDRGAYQRVGALWLQDPVWKDGTKFGDSTSGSQFTNPYDCRMGKSEGENTNYLYCFNIGYSKEVKEIDSDGNILNINNYEYRVDITIDTGNIIDTETISRTTAYGQVKSIELTTNPVVDYECEEN